MDTVQILEEKLQKLGEHIDSNIEQALEAQKSNLNTELDNLKTNEINGLVEKYNKLQEQTDALESASKRKSADFAPKSWIGDMVGQIKSVEGFANQVRSNKGVSFNVPMFTKTGTVLTGASDFVDSTTSANVVVPDYQTDIIYEPDRPTHVRQFLPGGTTTSDVVRYIQETSLVDGTAMKAEGADAGNTTFDLTSADAPVRTIASFARISNEMLDDVAGLTAYLSARLPKKIKVKEDNILLFGSDSPAFSGITEVASAYVDSLADANVNRFDILIKAIAQVRDGEYQANAIMVHPDDYFNLLLIKDAQGRYLMPDNFRLGSQVPTIAGVQLVPNTAMTTDKFLVGDFSLGAQVFDRQQSSIRFYEQDQDNAIKGVITVVASERLAMPVYRPTAFIYGDFSDALTAGAS